MLAAACVEEPTEYRSESDHVCEKQPVGPMRIDQEVGKNFEADNR
jgi:hypothetical protein